MMHEGDSIHFQVIRKRGPGTPDVTARSAGTRYLVFVGSGLANDPAPQIIIGDLWPPNLNAASIRIDDVRGVITVPEIGSVNWFSVIIFARNDDSVGWLFLLIDHRTPRANPRDQSPGSAPS
jgi:hypothetical protein